MVAVPVIRIVQADAGAPGEAEDVLLDGLPTLVCLACHKESLLHQARARLLPRFLIR